MINVQVTGSDVDKDAILGLLSNLQGLSVAETTVSDNLDGLGTLYLFLSIGGGVIITELAKIVRDIIGMNKIKSFKIDNVEILDCPYDKLIKILDKLKKDAHVS